MDRIKTASGQAARKDGLLINGDFALLWSGQAISKLGDVVFDYTSVFSTHQMSLQARETQKARWPD